MEGKLAAGPFGDLADAVLSPAEGRNLALRLGPDGTFRAGSLDILPAGDFLAGAVLSDRQQRRQDLYRAALKRPVLPTGEARAVVLAWARPIDLHFTLLPGARTAGSTLLSIPLRLEPPAPGQRVTIPGPLVPYRRILGEGPVRPTLTAGEAAAMHLRFQLPAVVLPFTAERARLAAQIAAPGRRVTVAGLADNERVELRHEDSPLDPINVEINDERLLRTDADGGLHLKVEVGPAPKAAGPGNRPVAGAEKWAIEYIELEVTGRVTGDRGTR
jgi:hypothetical protein